MSEPRNSNVERLSERDLTILLKELDIINRQIQQYDDHSLKIKNWAITIWSAATFFSITQYFTIITMPLLIRDLLLYLPIFIAIPFWIFDALYKKFQRTFIARSEAIRDFLNNRRIEKKRKAKTSSHYDVQAWFDNFPIYDPVGRSSRDTKYYKEIYFKKIDFLRCFLVRIVSMVYFILMALSSIITIVLVQNYYMVIVFIIIFILIILSWILGERGIL